VIYLLIIIVGLWGVWLIRKKREHARFMQNFLLQSYLGVFDTAILASDRGRFAKEMSDENPRIANDLEFFVNTCISSGIKPELAASAWIDRALEARFN
jgi:hypothetical protein